MPANNDPPSSHAAPSTSRLSANRTALAEYQESPWTQVAAWAEPSQAASLNLVPYLHALRRHWVGALVIGLLCGLIAGALIWFMLWPAQYKATAYLQVMAAEPQLTTLTKTRPSVTQTAYDIFKNTQLQTMINPQVLLAALRPTEIAELPCVKRETDPVAWLQEELQVSFPGEAEIMEVSLVGDDAEAVTKLVRAVVKAYLDEAVERKQTERKARLQELDDACTEKKKELQDERRDQTNLAAQLGTPNSDVAKIQQANALNALNLYNSEYIKMQIACKSAEEELKAQKALLESLPSVEISDAEVDTYGKRTDPQFKQMLTEVAFRSMALVQDQLARARGNATGPSRFDQERQAIEAQLAPLRDQLREEIRATRRAEIEDAIRQKTVELNAYTAQEKQLAEDVARQKKEVQTIGGSSVDLEMMERDIANADTVLSAWTAEREDLKVELRSNARRIRVLQDALKPLTQDSLEIRVAVAVLGVIAGLCLPAVGIIWWDTRSKRVNSAEDISKNIDATVLGSVPLIPSRVIRHLGSPTKQHRNWHLRLTEAVDGVAARLLRQAEIGQYRTVLVTSAMGSEGKTTLATQLAMSLARSGRRTVLVDFDLRRPAFDEIFGLPLEPGVSETLRGERDFTQPVVHETGTENLAVVTAGRWDRHALAALANGAAGPLLERLRSDYEFVVIDASPILPVADTRFVSQYVDTVVLTVLRDVSQIPRVEAACQVLRAFGCDNVAAVVIGPTDTLDAKDLGYGPRLLESA